MAPFSASRSATTACLSFDQRWNRFCRTGTILLFELGGCNRGFSVKNSETSIADAVLRLAARVSPAERREWPQAMQAEARHVSPDKALSFAMGCLWAMVHARITASSTLLNTARWTLVIGAVVWSLLHIRLAGLLSASGASIPSALAYVAAVVIVLGSLVTAAKGLRAAFTLAAPVAVLAGFVAIGIDHWLPQSSFAHFYRAIAIEYVFILLLAMLIAIGVPHLVEQRERSVG